MPGGSKSERTKLRIQQAAAKLFASRSFETVSTRAIAKEAGVDAALIHHYFGSKEGLFQAVLNAAIRPEQLEALVVSESSEDWGRQLVRAADKVWTSPAAPALKAGVRGGGGGGGSWWATRACCANSSHAPCSTDSSPTSKAPNRNDDSGPP